MINNGSKYEVTLRTGAVHNCQSGEGMGQLGVNVLRQDGKPWKHIRWTEGLATRTIELFLAGKTLGGLGISDVLTLWPGVWKNATSLQKIKQTMGTQVCKINKCLKGHGLTIRIIEVKWALLPDRDYEGECSAISEAEGGDSLEFALRAFKKHDYANALSYALDVLRLCGESHQARLVIGTCVLLFGHDADYKVARDTATFVRLYEHNLLGARTKLTELWEHQPNQKRYRWGYIPEIIRDIDQKLEAYQVLFERARAVKMKGAIP